MELTMFARVQEPSMSSCSIQAVRPIEHPRMLLALYIRIMLMVVAQMELIIMIRRQNSRAPLYHAQKKSMLGLLIQHLFLIMLVFTVPTMVPIHPTLGR